MSLVAWYPLNNDLKDYGLNGLNLTLDDATYETSPIGRGLKINSKQTSKVIIPQLVNKQIMSVSFWLKMNTANYIIWYDVLGFGVSNSSSYNTVLRLEATHYDNTWDVGSRLVWFGNNAVTGNGGAGFIDIKSGDYELDKWVHLTFIFDGEHNDVYIDGNFKRRINLDTTKYSDYFFTGTFYIGDINMYHTISDIRIYDHVLSKEEISDISKALILHYNFESPYGMKNLLKNSKDERTGTRNGGNIFIDYSYSDELKTTTERTFTVSADIKGSVDGLHTDFYFRNSAGNLMHSEASIYPTTEYKRYSIKITLASGQNISDFRIFRYRLQTDGTVYIKNVKLVYGDGDSLWSPNPEDSDYDNDIGSMVYDSSGLGNDGIMVGNVQYDYDSIIGKYSMKFSGNETKDRIDITNGAPSWWKIGDEISELTFSSWFKVDDDFDWSYSPNLIAFGGNSFIRYRLQSQASIWAYGKVGEYNTGKTGYCKDLQDGKWHTAVFTFDNGIWTLYLDGEQVAQEDKTAVGTTLSCQAINSWFIGAYGAGSETFVGNIDDCRVYATALSADDIKSLYEVKAHIDKIGNVKTGVFEEKNVGEELLTSQKLSFGQANSSEASIEYITNGTQTINKVTFGETNTNWKILTTVQFNKSIILGKKLLWNFSWKSDNQFTVPLVVQFRQSNSLNPITMTPQYSYNNGDWVRYIGTMTMGDTYIGNQGLYIAVGEGRYTNNVLYIKDLSLKIIDDTDDDKLAEVTKNSQIIANEITELQTGKASLNKYSRLIVNEIIEI